jgi:hypothetical protein
MVEALLTGLEGQAGGGGGEEDGQQADQVAHSCSSNKQLQAKILLLSVLYEVYVISSK